MTARLMLLPARKIEDMKIVSIPSDFDARDALRRATSLIASVEEENPDFDWEDIAMMLEDNGFEVQAFTIGPDID